MCPLVTLKRLDSYVHAPMKAFVNMRIVDICFGSAQEEQTDSMAT